MDYNDVHKMKLPELETELERLREARWIQKDARGWTSPAIDKRMLAVRHAISRARRMNTKITQ